MLVHSVAFVVCTLVLGWNHAHGFGFHSVTQRAASTRISLGMKIFDWKKREAFDKLVIPDGTPENCSYDAISFILYWYYFFESLQITFCLLIQYSPSPEQESLSIASEGA